MNSERRQLLLRRLCRLRRLRRLEAEEVEGAEVEEVDVATVVVAGSPRTRQRAMLRGRK